MKKNLALFDFDGTLTTRDTLFEILRFRKGALALNILLIRLLPILLLTKLKIYPAQRAKEILLAWAFSGMEEMEFNKFCQLFCETKLLDSIRQAAIKKLKWHLERQDEVAIVSASAENWIRPWANQFKIEVIASKLEVNQSKIAGKISGANCNGMEKVKRVEQVYNLKSYDRIYAYGDSAGDEAMLSIAHEKFFRKF